MVGDLTGHDDEQDVFGINGTLKACPSGQFCRIREDPLHVNTEVLESPVRKHLNGRFIKVIAAFDTQTLDYYGEIRNVLFEDILCRCIRYA